MRLMFFTLEDAEHGMGHKIRCQALESWASSLGHECLLAPSEIVKSALQGELSSLTSMLQRVRPDWLLIDVPEMLPEGIFSISNLTGVSVALLNGTGLYPWEDQADVVFIQSTVKEAKPYSGPEYILLRRAVFSRSWSSESFRRRWAVYGGASDVSNLRQGFSHYCPKEPAWVLQSTYSSRIQVESARHYVRYVQDDKILDYFARAQGALVSMGMVAWECVSIGVPTFVTSPTKEHLYWAQCMAEAGLIKAYNRVGLPQSALLWAEFLSDPMIPPREGIPTINGPQNVLKVLLERASLVDSTGTGTASSTQEVIHAIPARSEGSLYMGHSRRSAASALDSGGTTSKL